MNKREQILNSALGLFVELGFHGTPTIKIAQKAKVSNGTLFHYFKTKDELIIELYITIKNDLNDFLKAQFQDDDSIQGKFQKIFTLGIQWALNNPEKFSYIQLVLSTPNISVIPEPILKEQSKMHKDLIEDALIKGIIKKIPNELIESFMSSHFFGVYNYVCSIEASKRNKAIYDSYELFWSMISA